MIVHLYRESILNIFNEIRSDTAEKRLNVNLSTERIFQRKSRRNVQIQTDLRATPVETPNPPKPINRKHFRNVRVQMDFIDSISSAGTASEYSMSLDERIRMFEKKFRDDEDQFTHSFVAAKRINQQNRFKEHRKRRHSSISLESPHSSVDSSIHRSTERTEYTDNESQMVNANPSTAILASTTPIESVVADDSVGQEMMALFGDDEETDIFGDAISTSTVEFGDKLSEIDNVKVFRSDSNHQVTDTKLDSELKNTPDNTNELKNSIWPCELHMQRLKLHKALMNKADKGFRYSEKLRRKFEDLFGPEDDDDEDNSFAPYR